MQPQGYAMADIGLTSASMLAVYRRGGMTLSRLSGKYQPRVIVEEAWRA